MKKPVKYTVKAEQAVALVVESQLERLRRWEDTPQSRALSAKSVAAEVLIALEAAPVRHFPDAIVVG